MWLHFFFLLTVFVHFNAFLIFHFRFEDKMSIKQCQLLNNRMEEEINYLLGIVEHKTKHLKDYWYTLKLFTHGMHAMYKLLHKFLVIYGNGATSAKWKYHNLIYGPRSIKENLDILTKLCKFTSFQVAWIGCVVRFSGALPTLNNAAMIFKRLIRFFGYVGLAWWCDFPIH